MVNFGGVDTVPDQYQKAKRTFYEWNPSVTLSVASRSILRVFWVAGAKRSMPQHEAETVATLRHSHPLFLFLQIQS